jgi:hypothetical protein
MRNQGLSLLAWVGVWAFWLTLTHAFHPTFTLAVIVTTSLVVAYAAAAYINHLILLPKFWVSHHRIRYACLLTMTMIVLTGTALAVIRMAYAKSFGPDPDSNGLYKHFIIDLSGMAVHLGLAALVVRIVGRQNHDKSC